MDRSHLGFVYLAYRPKGIDTIYIGSSGSIDQRVKQHLSKGTYTNVNILKICQRSSMISYEYSLMRVFLKSGYKLSNKKIFNSVPIRVEPKYWAIRRLLKRWGLGAKGINGFTADMISMKEAESIVSMIDRGAGTSTANYSVVSICEQMFGAYNLSQIISSIEERYWFSYWDCVKLPDDRFVFCARDNYGTDYLHVDPSNGQVLDFKYGEFTKPPLGIYEGLQVGTRDTIIRGELEHDGYGIYYIIKEDGRNFMIEDGSQKPINDGIENIGIPFE